VGFRQTIQKVRQNLRILTSCVQAVPTD